MKQLFSFLTFGCITLLALFAGTCKNDSPVKPPSPTPPDTTSHEVVWDVHIVGDWGTHLDDVFALSPDFVIAVGKVQDSSQYPYPNNCYLWDGNSLKPFSMPINNNDTVTIDSKYRDGEINSIWMFRRDNLWYAMDNKSTYAHLTIANGDTNLKSENNFVRTDISGAMGWAIWAKDTNDIFFGGSQGGIIRYHDKVWIRYKIETVRNGITDLWGLNSDNVFMCANGGNSGYFYRYDGSNWNLLWTNSFPSLADSVNFGQVHCTWGLPNSDSIWIAGMWLGKMKKDGSGKVRLIKSLESYGLNKIRGSKWNNIFFVGGMGAILHYNGNSLHFYNDYYGNNWVFTSVAVLDNNVYIVGRIYGAQAGIFIHGKMK